MTAFRQWADDWDVPMAAVVDYEQRCGLCGTPDVVRDDRSEAYVASRLRLEASQKGVLLMRNNVGALKDEKGRVVRFGLCNSSKEENAKIKSSDWLGVRKRLILPADVGTIIGQIVARETKRPDWVYSGTGREPAQFAFINLINAYGGDACFATGEGTL